MYSSPNPNMKQICLSKRVGKSQRFIFTNTENRLGVVLMLHFLILNGLPLNPLKAKIKLDLSKALS